MTLVCSLPDSALGVNREKRLLAARAEGMPMSTFAAAMNLLWLVSAGVAILQLALLVAKRWFVFPRAAFRIAFACGFSLCFAWVMTILHVARQDKFMYVHPSTSLGFLLFLPVGTGLAGFASFSSRWRYPPVLLSFLGLFVLVVLVAGGFLLLALRIPR